MNIYGVKIYLFAHPHQNNIKTTQGLVIRPIHNRAPPRVCDALTNPNARNLSAQCAFCKVSTHLAHCDWSMRWRLFEAPYCESPVLTPCLRFTMSSSVLVSTSASVCVDVGFPVVICMRKYSAEVNPIIIV